MDSILASQGLGAPTPSPEVPELPEGSPDLEPRGPPPPPPMEEEEGDSSGWEDEDDASEEPSAPAAGKITADQFCDAWMMALEATFGKTSS